MSYNTEQTEIQQNNEGLLNEYISVLAKKVNEQSLEVITFQARINLAIKEKEHLLGLVRKANADIEGLKNELLVERNRKPEQVEVIKEVEVKVADNEAIAKENYNLRKEIKQLESKIKNLKERTN